MAVKRDHGEERAGVKGGGALGAAVLCGRQGAGGGKRRAKSPEGRLNVLNEFKTAQRPYIIAFY